ERPGVLLKNETPRSKQNALATALKKRYAKTCFQIPHLLRNTRLRNSEPVSRAAKASRFGDREKIAEMADVQRLRHGRKNIVRRGWQMQSGRLTLKAHGREWSCGAQATYMRKPTGRKARANESKPSEFRLDYGSRFCLHRKNLSRYFQNL